jgi:uncharacterized protein YfdQ (DUF2303 family)
MTQAINVEAILEAGRKLGMHERSILTVDAPSGQKFVLIPGKTDLEPLPILPVERRNKQPEYLKASPVFKDWQSFVEYVNRFKDPATSVIFVEKKTVDSDGDLDGDYRMKALLDFHAAGANGQSWLDHSATLDFLPCVEWVRWTGIDRQAMSQEAFIEFIEENLRDIVSPEPLTVLDMVQNFEAERIVKIVSKRRLADGTASVMVNIEGSNGTETKETKIPQRLKLSLRPFDGFDPVEVTARLRYTASTHEGLTFTVVLDRLSDVLEPAFARISDQIKAAVTLPLLVGKNQ